MARKIRIDPSMLFEMQFDEQELRVLHMFCNSLVNCLAGQMEYYQTDPREVTFSPQFEAQMERLIRQVDRASGYVMKTPGNKKRRVTRVQVRDNKPL